jgi:hypothetical protein
MVAAYQQALRIGSALGDHATRLASSGGSRNTRQAVRLAKVRHRLATIVRGGLSRFIERSDDVGIQGFPEGVRSEQFWAADRQLDESREQVGSLLGVLAERRSRH